MHTGEGPGGGGERDDRRDQRDAQRIGIGGGDDSIARIQLAARWSEAFAPENGDSLPRMLRRFRTAYDYLDAVIHGVEPAEIEPDSTARPSSIAASAPPAPPAPAPPAPPAPAPPSAPEPPAPEPLPEPRPW
jgi:hypothetical protein